MNEWAGKSGSSRSFSSAEKQPKQSQSSPSFIAHRGLSSRELSVATANGALKVGSAAVATTQLLRGGDSLSHLEHYQYSVVHKTPKRSDILCVKNLLKSDISKRFKIMSALESPPTLTPAWQDPWCAMTGTVTAADFYDQSKTQMTQAFYPHQPHMAVHGYPHPAMMNDSQNNNNNSMNSGSEGSTNSSVSAKKQNSQRQVNFKLDIKAEPQESQQQVANVGMQKVPSISDLSDPESSIDIPCNQVRLNFSI